jgi:transposase
MNDKGLYAEILGIVSPWEIKDVQMDLGASQVEIIVDYTKGTAPCAVCSGDYGIYDQREQRRWRHLDTCQLKTYLVCAVPRVRCPEHGVKTIGVPWAEKSSRFTVLFERFAIDLLLVSKNQTKTATLLRTSFDSINHMMHRAVERRLARRENTTVISALGIDEKSFKANHHYVSVLSDLSRRRVLDVVPHRSEAATQELITKALTAEQQRSVQAICMDMWKPFMKTSRASLPHADIVHDRFHVIKYLNDAVDATRRKEAKQLVQQNNGVLTGTRFIFLKNSENLTDAQRLRFEQLQSVNLATCQAWRMKENFKGFFDSANLEDATNFIHQSFNNVHASSIDAMKKVALTLQNHLQGLLNYITHKITNSVAEGLNALIQEIKFVARGFRRFENFRVAILFYLGKLDLYPHKSR